VRQLEYYDCWEECLQGKNVLSKIEEEPKEKKDLKV